VNALRARHVGAATRVIVGAVLVFSAATKLVHPTEFASVVQAYEILPVSLVGPAAVALTWIELLLGGFIIFGLFSRMTLPLAGMLLGFFLALMALAWIRGKSIDCGCFIGVVPETVGPFTLARDFVIFALIIPSYVALPHQFSLDQWLQSSKTPHLRRTFSALAVAIVALAFGLFVSGFASVPQIQTTSVEGWRLGPATAKVTITEFGDYQCSACAAAAPVLRQLLTEYDGQVALVFRNFPLPGHPFAEPAAEAAEAAGEQGKFWEMHDLLYADQQRLSPQDLRARAAYLGLDLRKFDEAISSGRARKRVETDIEEGKRIGLWYTPWIMVNGQVVQPNSYAAIKAAIENQLKKQ